jgi:hypothetical protein
MCGRRADAWQSVSQVSSAACGTVIRFWSRDWALLSLAGSPPQRSRLTRSLAASRVTPPVRSGVLEVDAEVPGEQDDQDHGDRREANGPVPAIAPATLARAITSRKIRRMASVDRVPLRYPLHVCADRGRRLKVTARHPPPAYRAPATVARGLGQDRGQR